MAVDRATDPLTIVHVPIDSLRPNPWNPNEQTPRVNEAVRESIEEFGFLDAVLVRPHPDGGYEIVDGEHRWDAAKDAGLDTVAVTVRHLTDTQAKRLTIILNETRGQADAVGLATLLAGLADEMPLDQLILGLPYTPDELADHIKMADLDWGTGDDVPTDRVGDGEHDPAGWSTINCRIPADDRAVAQAAFDAFWIGKDAPEAEDVRWGLFLGHLAGDYLAAHANG